MNSNKMSLKILPILFIVGSIVSAYAQIIPVYDEKIQDEVLDSIYIAEIENKPGKSKVLHAEPLYIDLIRDLGARKGEKEWNVAFGLNDNARYDKYEALVEYERAPLDRLGLEIELPILHLKTQLYLQAN